ncbi:MAG: general secretion pathway protein GspB [Pseudomonadota bacterium]|nr:general secretion pathway protein GspB [Pseudomonadota bacterium]
MSYILDALRKSETERRQGRVPDLGQQVQLIHRPKKKRASPAVWVALALMLNAGVLAFVFWPGTLVPWFSGEQPDALSASDRATNTPEPLPAAPATEPISEEAVAETKATPESPASGSVPAATVPERPTANSRERATVIVPSSVLSESSAAETSAPVVDQRQAGRVPHLVELPLSFQKSVPDLTFNSHIYSSSAASSRVMINNSYLKVGDTFEGLRVDDITEKGVVLSRDGRRFRLGVVRDWVSPR